MSQSESLLPVIESFEGINALVVGDCMVDEYIRGDVKRISPEAPVPVVEVNERELRPGGAANVAMNLNALGANVDVCTMLGDDEKGHVLIGLLDNQGIGTGGMLMSNGRITTVKTRIFHHNHQLLRYDHETVRELTPEDEARLIHYIDALLEEKPFDLLIFQDYDKGVLTPNLIHAVCKKAKALQVPVAVDPKVNNFFSYRNPAIFKPNLREVSVALGKTIDGSSPEELKTAARLIHEQVDYDILLITLSEKGIFLHCGDIYQILPAQVRQVADVSGAGDTVISVAALAYAAKANPVIIAYLANLAGGIVCEIPGVAVIDKHELQREARHHLHQLEVAYR